MKFSTKVQKLAQQMKPSDFKGVAALGTWLENISVQIDPDNISADAVHQMLGEKMGAILEAGHYLHENGAAWVAEQTTTRLSCCLEIKTTKNKETDSERVKEAVESLQRGSLHGLYPVVHVAVVSGIPAFGPHFGFDAVDPSKNGPLDGKGVFRLPITLVVAGKMLPEHTQERFSLGKVAQLDLKEALMPHKLYGKVKAIMPVKTADKSEESLAG